MRRSLRIKCMSPHGLSYWFNIPMEECKSFLCDSPTARNARKCDLKHWNWVRLWSRDGRKSGILLSPSGLSLVFSGAGDLGVVGSKGRSGTCKTWYRGLDALCSQPTQKRCWLQGPQPQLRCTRKVCVHLAIMLVPESWPVKLIFWF